MCLTVLEAGRLRSRCGKAGFLGGLSLACKWPPSCCCFTWSFLCAYAPLALSVCPHFSSYDASQIGWEPTLTPNFNLMTFCFLRRSLTSLPSLECSGAIAAHCYLRLLDPSDSLASASWVAGTTGVHHHTQLIFVFLVETGFHHVGQAGFRLSIPKCEITGVSHLALANALITSPEILSWATDFSLSHKKKHRQHSWAITVLTII